MGISGLSIAQLLNLLFFVCISQGCVSFHLRPGVSDPFVISSDSSVLGIIYQASQYAVSSSSFNLTAQRSVFFNTTAPYIAGFNTTGVQLEPGMVLDANTKQPNLTYNDPLFGNLTISFSCTLLNDTLSGNDYITIVKESITSPAVGNESDSTKTISLRLYANGTGSLEANNNYDNWPNVGEIASCWMAKQYFQWLPPPGVTSDQKYTISIIFHNSTSLSVFDTFSNILLFAFESSSARWGPIVLGPYFVSVNSSYCRYPTVWNQTGGAFKFEAWPIEDITIYRPEFVTRWSFYDIEFTCPVPVTTAPATMPPSSQVPCSTDRPIDSWTCVNNTWIANGSQEISAPQTIIEAPVIITGSLNITNNQSRILMTYQNTTIFNVSGTADLGGVLVLSVPPKTAFGPLLIGYAGNISRPFASVEVVSSDKCMNSTAKQLTDGKSLSVLLQKSSSCEKMYWIIPAIVVGSIIGLTLVLVAIGYLLKRNGCLRTLWHSEDHSHGNKRLRGVTAKARNQSVQL